MRELAFDNRPGLSVICAAAVATAFAGVLVTRSPVLALIAIGALGVGVAAARFGLVAVVISAFGLLPWMVILEGVLPAQVGTLTAAAGAVALLLLVSPLSFDTPLVPTAAFAFVAIVLAHAIFATELEQLIQATKYMVFLAVVLAVSSERAREVLPRLKGPVLASCLAAMVFHLGVIVAGQGASSTYYEAGEKLGFAAEGPHALALMSMIVAAAGLTVKSTRLSLAFFALGAVPAVLTGVRSALLGLVVILLIYLIQLPSKKRALAVVGAVAAVAVASGALDVLTTRFAEQPGEFSSLSSAGSGRGEIWSIALDAWEVAGPLAWLFGTGLRSIIDFELAALGTGLVGHSDIVEVLVQLGVLGFVAWFALWIGLLRAHLRTLVLVPILTFGAVNGTLEYVAPLTVGLFLAATCVAPPSRAARP